MIAAVTSTRKKANYVVGKNGKVYNETIVSDLIDTNPQFMERALIKIYNRQTEDEKVAKVTQYHNHVGFSAADANKMCYYAKWVLSGRKLSGVHLDKCKATLKRTHSVEEINRNPYKCALQFAFAWDKTPQGAEYWIRIREELEFEFES